MPDIATNNFLESLSDYAWIGGHQDENQTDIFKWTDGTTFSFESWVGGQPNSEDEDSIYMDPAGNWLDGRGTDAKEFICQYKGITKVYGHFSLFLCLSVLSSIIPQRIPESVLPVQSAQTAQTAQSSLTAPENQRQRSSSPSQFLWDWRWRC